MPTASTFDWQRENVQNEVAEGAGRDGWREIIGVRSIDSSHTVREHVGGDEMPRPSEGKNRDGKIERQMQKVSGLFSFHL